MKPSTGTTDDKALFCIFVRVSPRFFRTDVLALRTSLGRTAKKKGAFPFMTGQAAIPIDIAP
jgi:hypothetical protein